MNYVSYLYDNVKYYYNSMNAATLSGAIDVIVVEQPDGSLRSTPFHVRFGKYGVFNFNNKFVDIEINGEEIDVKMKLSESGVAYFVEQVEGRKMDEQGGTLRVQQDQRKRSRTLDEGNNHANGIFGRMDEEAITPRGEYSSASSSRNSSRATSPVPQTEKRNPSFSARKKHSQCHLIQPKVSIQRNRLPFFSSIYSCRRNRSLPDLSNFNANGGEQRNNTEQQKVRARKSTVGVMEMRRLMATFPGREDAKLHRNGDVGDRQREQKQTETENGIREEDEEEGSSDSGIDLKSSSQTVVEGGLRMEALSDSELDNKPADSPLEKAPEWDWGEIPRSPGADPNNRDEAVKKSRWHWIGRLARRLSAVTVEDEEDEDKENIQNAQNGTHLGKARKSAAISIDCNQQPAGISCSLGASPSEPGFLADQHFPFSDKAKSADTINQCSTEKFKRSLRLSNEQLQRLNLDYGSNDARFSITTKFQGTAWCSCHIYLLHWTDKLVISDIDGTITKSDVLGHVIPAIGGTWAHSGVTELYTRIKMNGYQMVYLSSRAIGQSHYTKTYLMNVAQGSQTLPDGPVLLSPTSVLMAFKKEVIERRPEEFKIACLDDLKSLFPTEQPFFAGFGNRETDVKSYQAVDIPPEKIMIIDPRGRLRRADNRNGFVSDYATMAMSSVDHVFPPRLDEPLEQLSEFAAWRSNPDEFDHLVDAELDAYKQRRKESAAREGLKDNGKKRVDNDRRR